MDPRTPPAPSPFPSLVVRAGGLEPIGAYAEAQADFLDPDPEVTATLRSALEAHNAGVVAHFYMDAELQGVLTACGGPRISISDSLLMADAAVRMAGEGVERIVVLGVDFMSEGVRATLDAAGHDGVDVVRVVPDPIGCSLAESAESPAYTAWLRRAALTPSSLHVVYVNTSLVTKARAHRIVPTIATTSSIVVRLLLQAFAQIPDLHVWFGPDTYMGRNLEHLFASLELLGDDAIAELHPAHDHRTVAAARERLHHFEQGVCVVHHMFGERVAEQVATTCGDAFVTAHLEVPGEMFRLALGAQRHGEGVVGSTSDILRFIEARTVAAAAAGSRHRLRFVLGTEAGMVTSIVRRVRSILREAAVPGLEAEIIFPVAAEAVARTDDPALGIVPGVAAGEGCPVAGGCAICPYMKMNSLDALLDLLPRLSDDAATLEPFRPLAYTETLGGRTIAALGGETIASMRHFQQTGTLPDALVEAVAVSTRDRP